MAERVCARIIAERGRRCSEPVRPVDSDWRPAAQFIRDVAMSGVAVAVALLISGCERSGGEPLVSISGQTMGTTYHIKYAPGGEPTPATAPDAVQARIESLLAAIDRSMSTWRADSDISRFNVSDTTDWFPVDAGLVEVAAAAEAVSVASDGAFDITVKPLVDLWGFGIRGTSGDVPTEAAIAATKQRVGFRLLAWRRDPPALRKALPGVQIEVAAIAPGFAVDRITDLMKAIGIGGGVVELGGEVRTWGQAPGGRAWRVGIERPDLSGGVEIELEMRDKALSTSGSYRNYLKYGGVTYSHEIDPRSGRSTSHGTVAVAVVADTATAADAWSTALIVAGTGPGSVMAEREGLAARFIEVTEGQPQVHLTAQFGEQLKTRR